MASLNIPEPILNGLIKIATLSDKSFQELVAALEKIPLKIRQHRIFEDWPLTVEDVSQDDIKAIRDALIPLYIGSVSGKTPIASYVNDITDSLNMARGDAEWLRSDEDVERFKERLSRLLAIESLQLVAKGHDVLLEHAQTFSSARIISDIRPVFGDQADEPPRAAVLVHMLNLVYFSSGDRFEFVVALDTKDIQYLLDILERAKTKAATLEAMIASTNMTYLEVV